MVTTPSIRIARHAETAGEAFRVFVALAEGMAAKVGRQRDAAAGAAVEPFFNGLHLRLEADAAAWIATAGGQQRFWDRRARFPIVIVLNNRVSVWGSIELPCRAAGKDLCCREAPATETGLLFAHEYAGIEMCFRGDPNCANGWFLMLEFGSTQTYA